MAREDWQDLEDWREEKKREKEKDFNERILPFLKEECQKKKLIIKSLNDYQWRITNGKDYFDIWYTRAMTYINDVGTIRGFGYQEKNLMKQINLLIKSKIKL